MTKTWPEIRALSLGTRFRSLHGKVTAHDGTVSDVWHVPDAYWRCNDANGEPYLIENLNDRFEREPGSDTMLRYVKLPGLASDVPAGTPKALFRAHAHWISKWGKEPPVPTDEPVAIHLNGRPGWRVVFDADPVGTTTYVIDDQTGVVVHWSQGDQHLTLTDFALDERFDDELFVWSGPSSTQDDPRVDPEQVRRYQERMSLESMPRAIPAWLPLPVSSSVTSGDARTGSLTLNLGAQSQIILRRWLTDLEEPDEYWSLRHSPFRFRGTKGPWTFEVCSSSEIPDRVGKAILDSIELVDPPPQSAVEIRRELAAETDAAMADEERERRGEGRTLAEVLASGSQCILLRTDFSNQSGWEETVRLAWEPSYFGGGEDDIFPMDVVSVDNNENADLTVEQVLEIFHGGEGMPGYVFIADRETVTNDEHPLLALDAGSGEYEERGSTFRMVPAELAAITCNLSISNMDFADFANAADSDGVFRGFSS